MNNIEIKKPTNKRSVESLIEESAIDYEFNYEAQEMRRSYNLTIRDLNTRIRDQERHIEKLDLLLQQKDEVMQEQQIKNMDLNKELQVLEGQSVQLKRVNNQLKKRVHHLEYKLEVIEQNRKLVPMIEREGESPDPAKKKAIKKEAQKEMQDSLTKKVKSFTEQLKQYPMSAQLQNRVEIFLEQILYINPQTMKTVQNIFNMKKPVGMIAERKLEKEKLTDQQQWNRLQKSLDKLKKLKNRQDFKEEKQAESHQKKGPVTPQKSIKKIFVNYV